MRGREQQLLLCEEVAGTPSVGVSGFLDGRAGNLYAFMVSTYEAMIVILAFEKLRKSPMAKA
jgi:hypothetical protein